MISPTGPRERGEAIPWHDRALVVLPAVALALGVFLRVTLLWRKPFWADEAWVALMAQQPIGELLALIPKTTAPAGFAIAVKLCSLLPGLPPEVALRLLPLLAGIATVALIPRLVRALGGSPRAAAVAALLAATMPALVHYSRELKPYALDAFFATAFPLAALHLFRFGHPGPREAHHPGRAARFLPAALAVVTPLFSFGGVFPTAATIAWGWVHLLRRGPAAARLPWAAATAPFLLVLLLLGALLLVPQACNPLIRQYFRVEHLAGGLSLPAAAQSMAKLLETAARHQFPRWPWHALAAAAVGILAWPRPGRAAVAAIIGGSFLLATAMAAAGLYLVGTSRLLLFVAPFLIAAVSVGLDRSLALLTRGLPLRGAASLAAILVAGGIAASWSAGILGHYFGPWETGKRRTFLQDSFRDVPGIVEEAIRLRSPGEPVLVDHVLGNGVRYYARGRLPGAAFLRGKRPARRSAALDAWLGGVSTRAWVLLAASRTEPELRDTLARRGYVIREERRFRGAVLWEIGHAGHTAEGTGAPAPAARGREARVPGRLPARAGPADLPRGK